MGTPAIARISLIKKYLNEIDDLRARREQLLREVTELTWMDFVAGWDPTKLRAMITAAAPVDAVTADMRIVDSLKQYIQRYEDALSVVESGEEMFSATD